MPTNQDIYNSRVTDEALEKRFRDTFTSQGGAELVSDLYASGVIVPIVDFTAAAEGTSVSQNLQTAWDFSTIYTATTNTTNTLTSTPGFWKVDVTANADGGGTAGNNFLSITDGLTSKIIYYLRLEANNTITLGDDGFVVFLRSGDSLTATSSDSGTDIRTFIRQIADVNGNLVNPLGFTSS